MNCKVCNKEIPENEYGTCPECHQKILERIKLESSKLICPKCKNEVNEDWAFCNFCGNQLKEFSNTNISEITSVDEEKYNNVGKKSKSNIPIVIFSIIIVIIIGGMISDIDTTSNKETPTSLLMTEYNLTQEESEQVFSVIDNCGYSDYYSGYKLAKSIDNDEIEGSIGFEILIGEKIIGFVDIKDNKVCQIQYSDKILYADGNVQHTLSEYLITSDEETRYITATQEVIKKILKSPSTAKFPWNYNEWAVGKKDGSVIVQCYVDSQNGFGAMIRSTFQVTYTNETVTSIIFDGVEYTK